MPAIKRREARALVEKNPSSTAKELTKLARRSGIDCSRSEMNTALYGLLARKSVTRVEPADGSAPRWSAGTAAAPEPPATSSAATRVLELDRGRLRNLVSFVLNDGTELVVGEDARSPNDPYIAVDVLDTRVVVSINTSHPIGSVLYGGDTAAADLVRAAAGVDGLMLMKTQRAVSRPSGQDLIRIRDAYLRELMLRRT